MEFNYKTSGTCSSHIKFTLEGNVVKGVSFTGGCNGNLKGIASLVEGLTVEQIVERCAGITCGFKNTSCPDQLAKAVKAAYDKENNA